MAVQGETSSMVQGPEGYQGSNGLGLFEGCHNVRSYRKFSVLQN